MNTSNKIRLLEMLLWQTFLRIAHVWWGGLSKSIEMSGEAPLSKSPFTFKPSTPQHTLNSQRCEPAGTGVLMAPIASNSPL